LNPGAGLQTISSEVIAFGKGVPNALPVYATFIALLGPVGGNSPDLKACRDFVFASRG
jgi:hypothetical protein